MRKKNNTVKEVAMKRTVLAVIALCFILLSANMSVAETNPPIVPANATSVQMRSAEPSNEDLRLVADVRDRTYIWSSEEACGVEHVLGDLLHQQNKIFLQASKEESYNFTEAEMEAGEKAAFYGRLVKIAETTKELSELLEQYYTIIPIPGPPTEQELETIKKIETRSAIESEAEARTVGRVLEKLLDLQKDLVCRIYAKEAYASQLKQIHRLEKSGSAEIVADITVKVNELSQLLVTYYAKEE